MKILQQPPCIRASGERTFYEATDTTRCIRMAGMGGEQLTKSLTAYGEERAWTKDVIKR